MGVGDFNGDGKPDLAWQHKTTGGSVCVVDGWDYLEQRGLGFNKFRPQLEVSVKMESLVCLPSVVIKDGQ